ncbi:MAG: SEC-C metal-binding domain-containing protein [Gammaproteobacteria bacterium]
MHRLGSIERPRGAPAPQRHRTTSARAEKFPGAGRNAPCPCNSGREYKLCCGR